MSDDTETNEEYDWHTDTELGLEEQIEKTKDEQKIAKKQAKARRKQQERIAKKKGKLKKEQERLERLQEGTDTFCDRHPKMCKAGKAAAVAGAVVTSPIWVPEAGADYIADKAKENVRPQPTPRPRTQTVARPRTTTSKTKTTTKRTASTSKRSKPSQNARKPTQKRTTASKARKSTPKKKSPKKPKGSDWWSYGEAGL